MIGVLVVIWIRRDLSFGVLFRLFKDFIMEFVLFLDVLFVIFILIICFVLFLNVCKNLYFL